jgi:hypothetical protein
MRTVLWKTLIANEDRQGKATDVAVAESLEDVTKPGSGRIPPLKLDQDETISVPGCETLVQLTRRLLQPTMAMLE